MIVFQGHLCVCIYIYLIKSLSRSHRTVKTFRLEGLFGGYPGFLLPAQRMAILWVKLNPVAQDE